MEGIYLHYGIKDKKNPHAIKLETFATTACAIGEIIKEIAYIHFPDIELTVHVEGLDSGSFLAYIRPLIRNAASWTQSTAQEAASKIKNTAQDFEITKPNVGKIVILPAVAGIIIGISVLVFQHTFYPDNPTPATKVDNDAIDIQEKAKQLSTNNNIQKSINKVAKAVVDDGNIKSLGFAESKKSKPMVSITREDFEKYHAKQQEMDKQELHNNEGERVDLLTDITLHLHGVLLGKDSKKWVFFMGDEQISAPLLDDIFYQKIENHEIIFGAGDKIVADIKRTTFYDKLSGKIKKKGVKYQVIKVKKYDKSPQENLFKPNYPNESLG
jgi:hypothetical protein